MCRPPHEHELLGLRLSVWNGTLGRIRFTLVPSEAFIVVGYQLSYDELCKGLVLRYVVEHPTERFDECKKERGTLK